MRSTLVLGALLGTIALSSGCGIVIGLDKIKPRLSADGGAGDSLGSDASTHADAATESDGAVVPIDAGADGAPCTACECPQSCATRFTTDTHWTVPPGCMAVTVLAWGAGGGAGFTNASQGGAGGFVQGTFDTQPGQHLEIFVGRAGASAVSGAAGGAPGGGQGGIGTNRGGGGGGLSGVFVNFLPARATAIVVAGEEAEAPARGRTTAPASGAEASRVRWAGCAPGQRNERGGGDGAGNGTAGGDPNGGNGGAGPCGGGGGGAGIFGGGGGASDQGGICGGGGGGGLRVERGSGHRLSSGQRWIACKLQGPALPRRRLRGRRRRGAHHLQLSGAVSALSRGARAPPRRAPGCARRGRGAARRRRTRRSPRRAPRR
ncbi:MAG: hypothetical protein U0235_33780 [Polyangiaceae bacterium]